MACIVEGCENPVLSRGLCSGCYGRHRKHGTLEDVALPRASKKRAKKAETQEEPTYVEIKPVSTLPPKEWKPGIHVFTSAQNNTAVHKGFFETLLNYCQIKSAELHVIPIEYHPHGKTATGHVMWHPEVTEYLLTREMRLAPDLVVYPTMPVIPTAVRPLSSLGNFGGGDSFIIGHQKVAMESIATPQGTHPKFSYTTGSLTVANYSTSKAGRRAEFHHTVCGLVVEVAEDGEWWARQLHWSGGLEGVYDLGVLYTKVGATLTGASAVTLGDIHVAQCCNESLRVAASMLATLTPDVIIAHDVFDMRARNPHEHGNGFSRWRRYKEKTSGVEKELEEALNLLKSLSKLAKKGVVLPYSNHHEMLTTWLHKTDFREDPENAELILRLELIRRQQEGIDLFRWWMDEHKGDAKINLLGVDESYVLDSVELGQHGHLGANGARGNPMAFARLGMKSTIGHTHSAGIFDGCYVAGVTGKLKMGYTKGLSSWSHSHVIQHPGGKRQIVTLSPTHRWRL